jgi:hypothetical protein
MRKLELRVAPYFAGDVIMRIREAAELYLSMAFSGSCKNPANFGFGGFRVAPETSGKPAARSDVNRKPPFTWNQNPAETARHC